MRKTKEMNNAMLGRLGWRLLNEKEALWSSMLKSKYGRGREGIDIFSNRSRSSHIWKGIVDASKILEGTKWRLGNRRGAWFWEDPWQEDKPLLAMVKAQVPEYLLGKKVADFWNANDGWAWQHIESLLPHSTLLKMASVVLNKSSEVGDLLVWGDEPDGRFTVSKAYRKLNFYENPGGWTGWRIIWQLKVQQRLRTFLWLLAHEKLLSNFSRWRRRIATSPNCNQCIGREETNMHAVRDCCEARRVWLNFIPPSQVRS